MSFSVEEMADLLAEITCEMRQGTRPKIETVEVAIEMWPYKMNAVGLVLDQIKDLLDLPIQDEAGAIDWVSLGALLFRAMIQVGGYHNQMEVESGV